MTTAISRVSSTFAVSVALSGCGLVTGVLLARILLPEGRGALAAILFWPPLFAGLGFLSCDIALTRLLASTRHDAARIASSGFVAAGALAAFTIAVGWWLIPVALGGERIQFVDLTRTYFVFLVAIGFPIFAMQGVHQGLSQIGYYNLMRTIPSVVYLGGLCALIYLDEAGIPEIVFLSLGASCAPALVWLTLPHRQTLARPKQEYVKALVRDGSHFHIAAVVMLVGSQIDRLAVISICSDREVGLYVVAYAIAGMPLLALAQAFSVTLLPRIAGVTEPEELADTVARALSAAFFLLSAAAVLTALLIPWLIPVLFGDSFKPAVLPAVILAFGLVPMAGRHVIHAATRGLGDPTPSMLSEAIALAVFLLAALAVGQSLGLVGIGLGLLIANVLSVIYLASYLRRRLGLAWRDWMGLNLRTARRIMAATRGGRLKSLAKPSDLG